MGKILKTLDQLITGIGICSLFGLIVIAFIQVIFRYTLNNALPWPEEVCRFIFIILAYTGMAMTMRKNGHLRVDVLLSFVSPHVGKLLNILATFFTLLYCALGAWLTPPFPPPQKLELCPLYLRPNSDCSHLQNRMCTA